MIDQKTGFVGIVSSVAEMQAPPGALLRAENVVIRRSGSVEARPGVVLAKDLGLSGGQIQRIIPVEQDSILAYSTGSWWDYTSDAAVLYSNPEAATSAPPFFRADLIPSAQARGNTYIGYRDGVVKWTGAGSAFATAGVPLLFAFGGSAGLPGSFLPNGSWVGYSVVGTKTDANGLVTKSRPAGTVYVANGTGGARGVGLVIVATMTAGAAIDTYEIYRTRTFLTTDTPDAEMQLVGRVPYAVPTVNFNDDTADANRGATLYTSPSRYGAESANDRPPACGAMASFKGSLFFGNTSGPKRRIFSLNGGAGTNQTGNTAGIGYRTATATRVIGTNTLTLVSSTTGLQKGMLIAGGTPTGAYITNIAGATITMSANATSSAVGATFSFYDAYTADGVTWHISGADYAPYAAFANATALVYRITPPVGGYTFTYVAESFLRGTGAVLLLKATHGGECSPAIPEYDSAADTGDQDILPNGISWSKTDEPEHVPPVNYALVSDKKSAILNFGATRDALFIFKEDGIYRLTGTAGAWRIDPFDLTTKCVLPSSVVALNNKIYALTNKGVVTVSDAGVQGVSNAIGDQIKRMVYTLATNGAAGTGYFVLEGATARGYAACANERDSEYMLLVCDMISPGRSAISGVLVYNEGTGAWTSWSFTAAGAQGTHLSTLAWSHRLNTVLFGQVDNPDLVKALAAPDRLTLAPGATADPYACDGEVAITILSNVLTTAQYLPVYDFEVGDIIVDSAGAAHTITATPDATHATLDTLAATGAAVVIRPFTCKVEPRAFMAPNQVTKHWVQLNAEFAFLYGATQARSSAMSTITIGRAVAYSPTVLDVAKIKGVAPYYHGASIRSLLPTAAARGWALYARIEWDMAYGAASLESIFTEANPGVTNKPNLATAAT